MATIGGPKGPSDPPKVVGGKLLHFPQVKKAKIEVDLPEIKGEIPHDLTHSQGYDPNATKGTVVPEAPAENARGGNVRARLAALGQLPIKTAGKESGRVKDTPLGKIFDGSMVIDSVAGFKKLEGVARVSGDLTVQESAARGVDLLVLHSLIEVGGRLVIEGNGAIGVLDAFESLERARGIYVGFNAGLTKIALPKLKELDAAFIVEHNPKLLDISLPALSKGGRYLHVLENASLHSLSAPLLASLSDELSLLDNPRLSQVKIGSRERPVQVPTVETRGNGASTFALLFARA